MKPVAEQIQDLGLLCGICSSTGALTCARYEGPQDRYVAEAQSFPSWDIEYLKDEK